MVQKGGNGRVSLFDLNFIPELYRTAIKLKLGEPVESFNALEDHYTIDGKARMFYEAYRFEDKTHLTPEKITLYTVNASVFNAVVTLRQARETHRKRLGNSTRNIWDSLCNDVVAFNNLLKTKYNQEHKLPKNKRALERAYNKFIKEGYETLIDGRNKNQNAAKIATEKQYALLEQLLRHHNNFNNEQIAESYNIAAEQLKWKSIDATTVANYRRELGLYVHAGTRGETSFRSNKTMQVKRYAPTVSMAFWSLDGWDVELMYQREEIDAKGYKKTTYHNRLTVVVVMDPVAGIKYPVGYAIGTHESPALITEALRNAANHTREIFGQRHKPLQLQSDHYAIKALSPVYEAMSKHFTPARVRNAKAKPIEPYFLRLNKMCQKYFSNWSGFGVTSRAENQPNDEYLNKIRHQFPDEQGCREQIERIIEMERSEKINEYVQRFNALPEADRLPLSTGEYLYLFGETHSHTNKLQGKGLTPYLIGEKRSYDCFDPQFRELGYMDWAVKYDPSDLSTVLVLNAKSDNNSNVKEVIGTHRFELTAKYEQPMALYDRKDGDAQELHKVFDYNKQLEQQVIDRGVKNQNVIAEVFAEAPQLRDTLLKHLITDSNGQHKDNKSAERLRISAAPIKTTKQDPEPENYIIDDNIRTQY